MAERVRVTIDDEVAQVVLDRPDKLNGLDMPMFEGLIDAAEQLAAAPGLRAVVLSGAGRSFCAGLDFPAFLALGKAGQEKLLGQRTGPANLAQRVGWMWRELPVPVIAALQGHVYGGGLQIAMGADIRLARPDARFCIMEITWGLIPDMAFTRTLMGQVSPDVLAELTWTGRKVEAAEAVAIGLATRICEDPLAEATALARTIAGRNPDAIRAVKRLLTEAPALDTAAAFELETALQLKLLGSPNQVEAITANLQKRAPVFRDDA